MDFFEKKKQINEYYDVIIKKIERQDGVKDICQCLLKLASFLNAFSSVSITEKDSILKKAIELLNAEKDFSKTCDYESLYKRLTGRELIKVKPKEIKEEDNKNEDDPIKKEESILEGYTFKWDNITNVSFNDVIGMEEVKDIIFKKVMLPFKNPDAFIGYEKNNGGGMLLYGPPGTGKTMIAAAIANETNAKFCVVNVQDIIQSGIGNSEKAIKTLFEEARSFHCSIIFFDELECICPSQTRAQHAKQIRSALLSEMQGMKSYENGDNNILLLIGATNKPWEIDSAFLRPGRFGIRVFVGLPSFDMRKQIVKNKIEKIKSGNVVLIKEDIDFDKIAELTEGYNCADITHILEEVQESSIIRFVEGESKYLCMEDFIRVINNYSSSVNKEDLDKIEKWEK